MVGMKAATLHELKKQMEGLDAEALLAFCLRLAKFKKDNKELLTYLLYEAEDESGYVAHVKSDVDELFDALAKDNNLYFLKKSIRKILRFVNKQIKYSGNKQTELELRIHFCLQLKNSGIKFQKNPVLVNLYNQQIKKIHAALTKLPEDLQFDYQRAIQDLS
jgi:hypothetical protein